MDRDFVLKEEKGVKFYVFGAFEKLGFVKHCITTRCGGVYGELDMREDNHENHKIISKTLGIDFRKLVASDQVHDKHIYKASRKDW
ncbi:MAG TPA: laccase domain-containing protein, partial [Thermoanaerobacterales bacterium]|nr:laccase domain-containing protein [Thermoanaerobacterales bacterium]